VIVPDLNLLLYAYDTASKNHRVAASWWKSCVNGAEPVGIPHVVLFGFLRLATSGRLFESPMSLHDAAECLRVWLERPHVIEMEGGPGHVTRVIDLLRQAGTAGRLITDAQIAAIALEHSATAFTNDSDFRRFPGLRIVNPLVD